MHLPWALQQGGRSRSAVTMLILQGPLVGIPLGKRKQAQNAPDRGIKMSEHMGGDENACSLWSTGALLTAFQVCWVLEFMIHKMHGIRPVISKLRLCEDCIILNESSPSF